MSVEHFSTSRVTGLIGHPVSHSVSPAMQNAAFAYYGLDARYDLWDTPLEELPQRVARLREPDCLGANVTVPHKLAVMPFLDEISSEAQCIGAVNTIVNRKGWLVGHNTDAVGFSTGLYEAGVQIQGSHAAILGAGGSARAVALALLQEDVEALWLFNRHRERAEALAKDLKHLGSGSSGNYFAARDWSDTEFREVLASCDILINCTPVGMKEELSPLPAGLLPAGRLFVCDLIFNPPETKLLRVARERGNRTLNGLPMLVHQGAASFQLWTKREGPVEVMREAARQALAR